MIPRNLMFVATLAMVVCSCSSDRESSRQIDTACNVALEYVREFKSKATRPIALSNDVGLAPSREQIDLFVRRNPSSAKLPEIATARAEAAVRHIRVMSVCPGLRRWVKEEHIDNDYDVIGSFVHVEKWPFTVLTISLPVVSEDGNNAKFYISQYDAPLDRATYSVRYQRDNRGRWVLLEESMTSIS